MCLCRAPQSQIFDLSTPNLIWFDLRFECPQFDLICQIFDQIWFDLNIWLSTLRSSFPLFNHLKNCFNYFSFMIGWTTDTFQTYCHMFVWCTVCVVTPSSWILLLQQFLQRDLLFGRVLVHCLWVLSHSNYIKSRLYHSFFWVSYWLQSVTKVFNKLQIFIIDENYRYQTVKHSNQIKSNQIKSNQNLIWPGFSSIWVWFDLNRFFLNLSLIWLGFSGFALICQIFCGALIPENLSEREEAKQEREQGKQRRKTKQITLMV